MFFTSFVLVEIILKPTAYLDPGSGSFIIQLLFGAIVGGVVVIKANWARIRAYFNKSNQETGSNDQMNQEDGKDTSETS
jgi:hypothetical protein